MDVCSAGGQFRSSKQIRGEKGNYLCPTKKPDGKESIAM